ncbi:MAG: DUF1648 domain-containing protein [Sedimentisphaerales bacterium]|jgi:uncharacterized membrane protein HdeD (DUF308 family)
MSVQYRHSQPGYLMIIVGVILIVVAAVVYAYGLMPLVIILGATGIFLLVFGYKLTVEIKDGFLRFWFGVGIFWKRIAIEQIVYCEPFRGVFAGWGIRITPDGCLYNVSGMKAVTVVLKSGKKIHIGTDEPYRLVEAINSVLRGQAGDASTQMWCETKADYLKRVEQALSAARHPRSFEILADVGNHLDRRFAELGPQHRTWENFQNIITEMGPPSDYAELVSEDRKSGRSKLTKLELGVIGILLVVFGVSVYFYPRMPERIATQWDLRGQPSSYMPKPLGMFITPVIFAVLVIAHIVIPRTASVSVNIEGFRRFYGGLLIVFSIIMLAVQYQIILWNLGIKTNPNMVVVIAVSAVIVWMFVWYYRARRKKKQFD